MKKLLIVVVTMIAFSAGAQTKGDMIVRKSKATKKIDTLWVNPDTTYRIKGFEWKRCGADSGVLVVELAPLDSTKHTKTVTVKSDAR